MDNINPENNIPPQQEGNHVDLSTEKLFFNQAEAKEFFKKAKHRLLNVFDWKNCAALPMADFVVIDKEGNEVIRPVYEGDVLRIDIPGPGSVSGDGYDWVAVEQLKEEEGTDGSRSCSILLRPTSNPMDTDNKGEVSHFFKDSATSTLIVKQVGNKVVAEYYGRNEVINTDVEKTVDKVRNSMVGLGAKLGFSDMEWKCLIESFLK